MEEDNDISLENRYSKVPPQLRKYVFKAGNRMGGRPVGAKSLKTYAKEYLEGMTEEERVEYLNGLAPDFVWKMAEGNPENKTELSGELTSKIISVDE